MRYSKSQVTLFIIIGLVILIAFVLLFYLRNTMHEHSLIRNIESVRELFMYKGKYHAYVSSCMEQATKEGLYLIGMQGGAIYDYQAKGTKHYLGPSNGYPYGEHVIPSETDSIFYNVSYGIKSPELGSMYHPDIPFYPYGLTSLVTNPRVISPFYMNVFGNFPKNPMTPLCDYHGANRLGLSSVTACETYDSRSESDYNSIQQYLIRYIENRTMNCIHLESLPELSDMEVRMGNITANLTYGEEHVMVDITLPIMINAGRFESEIRLNDYHVMYKVRLKKIHELISHLVKKDVNDIFFNIVMDAPIINDCIITRNAGRSGGGLSIRQSTGAF